MCPEGIPDHRQFGGGSDEQSFFQERKLGGIDRQQGKAGVQFHPAVVVGALSQFLGARIAQRR